MTSAADVLREALAAHDLDVEETAPGRFVVVLPGERKQRTTVSMVVGDHALTVQAFVARHVDENAEVVYRWLLERNLRMYGVAFAVDHLGDIYLSGRLPLASVTPDEVDRLLGSVLEYADSSFNTILELGFGSSIRKEWEWRLSRGELLAEAGVLPDVVHTSLLRRAIKTSQIALDACDRHWIPVIRNWRLNERHYGALQGKNKAQTLEAYGEEQFMLWRRSYDTPPPAIDPDDEFSQAHDPRYAWLPPEANPLTECLKDVVHRLLPYWEDVIVPDLRAGKVVLVAAHGNSLRALVKHLDGISDDDIAALNIPTGIPLVYRLDENLRPTVVGGEYLDPEAAVTAAAAVAAQGKK